jgi:hypothetical protein
MQTCIVSLKKYNSDQHCPEWYHLNFNQILTTRQTTFNIIRNSYNIVGINALTNRLHNMNGVIPLVWLNKSYSQYKIKCKSRFFTFNWSKKWKLKCDLNISYLRFHSYVVYFAYLDCPKQFLKLFTHTPKVRIVNEAPVLQTGHNQSCSILSKSSIFFGLNPFE